MSENCSSAVADTVGEDPQAQRPWMQREACCATYEPCLQVRDLDIAYGGKAALRNVTLDIPRGCITAIVGPSGCGKSSFLSSLNRLSDLTDGCRVRGSIRIEGQEIVGADIDLIALRRQVGMIFQKPNPFPLSIRENLTFPLKHHGMRDRQAREAAVENVLRRVGLWEEVKDWASDIEKGDASVSVVPDQVLYELQRLKASSGIYEGQKEKFEKILWLYESISSDAALRRTYAMVVLKYVWDEYITTAKKRDATMKL